jgi:hypothetical protein
MDEWEVHEVVAKVETPQGPALSPTCVPVKVGVYRELYSRQERRKDVLMEIIQPTSVKSNIMGRKLRSVVNRQGALKEESVKQELGSFRSVVHTR